MWRPGIAIGAKFLLEAAVALLGASVDLQTVAAAGPLLLAAVVCVVAVALPAGYVAGLVAGLPPRQAVLVACGNAICDNSAIVAVAPVVGAKADDVAASIAFTAALGVLVVWGLPLAMPLPGLSPYGYGVLAGLTVYAVPQVVAATAPAGALAMQVGTSVKLLRVLMLGPIVLLLAFAVRRIGRPETIGTQAAPDPARSTSRWAAVRSFIPWFIPAFLALAALRSSGLLPASLWIALAGIATALAPVSLGALGLGVNVRAVGHAGVRPGAAVTASLLILALLGIGVVHLLGAA